MGDSRAGFLKAALAAALNETSMSRAMESVVQERFGKIARFDGVTAEQVQRRLIRYSIRMFDAEKEQADEWRIIGKIYGAPKQMEYGFKVMQQLWANGFSSNASDGIAIPEPIQCLPDYCLLLMSEAPGESIRGLVKEMAATPAHMRAAAEAIAKFHRCPVTRGHHYKVDEQLSHCNPAPQVLAKSLPELAAAISYIVETAQAIEKSWGEDIFTLVHGDFHPGHVLIDNGNVWLLDFDQLNFADPAYDLAEFFVFLKRLSGKKKMFDYIETLKAAFISQYFSIMGWEIAGREPLYESLLNLRRACKCFRMQDESGWEEKMRLLIESSVACMRAMEKDRHALDFDQVMEIYNSCPISV